jgi:uncharacterized membrane protein
MNKNLRMASIENKIFLGTRMRIFINNLDSKLTSFQPKIKKNITKKYENFQNTGKTRGDVYAKIENNSKKNISEMPLKMMNFIIEEDHFGKLKYRYIFEK